MNILVESRISLIVMSVGSLLRYGIFKANYRIKPVATFSSCLPFESSPAPHKYSHIGAKDESLPFDVTVAKQPSGEIKYIKGINFPVPTSGFGSRFAPLVLGIKLINF